MGKIGSKLELSAAAMAFPPFEKILLDREDHEVAKNEIRYIIWMYSWNSPYNVIAPEKRASYIKRDLFGNPDHILSQATLHAAKAYVEEFQTSEILEMLAAARDGIWFVNQEFRKLSSGESEYDADKILAMVGKMGKARESLKDLETAAKAEQESTSEIRGGGTLALFEE